MSEQLDSVRRVLGVMRETFGTQFKEYYDGDPEAIPVFNLPALIVDQTGDDTTEGAVAQDDVEDRLIIKVVLNKRDDFTGDKVDPLDLTARKIRDLVGRRDEATRKYAEGTIKHALRSMELTAGITAIANSMSVEYGINPRPTMGEDYADLTAEGHVTFAIEYSVDTD